MKLAEFALILIILLVRQDPTPCLCELRESRNLKLNLQSIHFRTYSKIYYNNNLCKFVTERKSFQLRTTDYQCATALQGRKIIPILQKR